MPASFALGAECRRGARRCRCRRLMCGWPALPASRRDHRHFARRDDGATVTAVRRNRPSDAVFSVTADLIDLRDRVVFGVRQDVNTRTSASTRSIAALALLDLTSRGDIRLLGACRRPISTVPPHSPRPAISR